MVRWISTELSFSVSPNVDEHPTSYDPEAMQDMCDHLLRAGAELSSGERETFQLNDQDIVNGSLTQAAGAGTGIPTFSLRWVLIYLMRYPQVQAELHREMDEALTSTPKMSDRSKMPYIQAFLNEVLRHAPITPLPAAYYSATRDAQINGYFAGKNIPVMVSSYSITRNPSVWENSDSFLNFPFPPGSRENIQAIPGIFMVPEDYRCGNSAQMNRT